MSFVYASNNVTGADTVSVSGGLSLGSIVDVNFTNQTAAAQLVGVIPLFDFDNFSNGTSSSPIFQLESFHGAIPGNTTSSAFSIVFDNNPAVEQYNCRWGFPTLREIRIKSIYSIASYWLPGNRSLEYGKFYMDYEHGERLLEKRNS